MIRVVCLTLLTGLCQISSYAATEYLRFEGAISSSYFEGYNDLYDLDFTSSQPLFFDIAIDTDLDRIGVADTIVVDYFQATLTGGTLGSGELSYGGSGRTVEFLFAFLQITPSLALSRLTSCDEFIRPTGCDWDEPIPPFDWTPGVSFVLSPSPNAIDSFGTVTLTYRGSEPPPPVPIPGAVWLMLSGLLGIRLLGAPGTRIAKTTPV